MASLSDNARQDTVRQILLQLQNITGRTDVEGAARTLELQAFQTCTGSEDYFGKIASRISAFSKRMANKPVAAGTGQAPAAVCLPLQTQNQQPRPYFQQQVASASGQDTVFSNISGGQQNAPGFFVPATAMMQQAAQPQNFVSGIPRPMYVSNVQGGESYQMHQQPGLILSQDPAVRMQQLQQHPEITSSSYPIVQAYLPSLLEIQRMHKGSMRPGQTASKAAFDDLDVTESSKPNAVAAALDASELVTQMDSAAADFDFADDFLGLFPSTPKPAGAMAAAASDISRMLWQNDTDLPFPPKDFTPSLEDWMCPEGPKPLRASTPISSAFIDGFLQDCPTSTELSSSTELDPVSVLGHKRKSGNLDEASSELSSAKKQCRDRLEKAVQACRDRLLRTAEVTMTGSNDYAGIVSIDCRVEPILPGMDLSASRITNRQGALLPETWKSLTSASTRATLTSLLSSYSTR
ncbi:hypothetical protein WJX84_008002 [Apatococcus fuscideae]|uniref:Mediator complex subunit 15 KIX domain-containing protein n=1 Tax=Apatococcus fuscideae TaxID=2026836 RepID=A0AAW1SLJ9_9CHLO